MTKRRGRPKKQIKKNRFKLSSLLFIFGFFILLLIFLLKFPIIKSQSTNISQNKNIPKLQKTETKEIASAPTTFISARVPILMYHYIEEVKDARDTIRQSLNINPFIFEQQIKTLKDEGYTFITVGEFSDILGGKTKLPAKPVVITIDDGHWDLYTDILPILERYNAKVTAYIIPGFLDGSDFLSRDQLQKISESGLVEIGAHTVHHRWLKGQSMQVVEKEVKESKTMLEELIKKPVVSFAYPSGAYDDQAVNVVKEAGFKTAVSTKLGIVESQTNKYFLFRIRPGRRTGEHLINYLNEIK